MIIIPFDQAISPKKVSNYFQKGDTQPQTLNPTHNLESKPDLVTLASSGGLAKGFIKKLSTTEWQAEPLRLCEMNPTKCTKMVTKMFLFANTQVSPLWSYCPHQLLAGYLIFSITATPGFFK